MPRKKSEPTRSAPPPMDTFLTGQLLIAMPQMPDPRFTRTVIYMCAHTTEGAMGLVINRLFGGIDFTDMLEQLSVPLTAPGVSMRVHFGGPVEAGRGFVLHSSDYRQEGTLMIDDDVGLTASVEILRDIASGGGPQSRQLFLGYAGWGPGQLDRELQTNHWIHAPADEALLFDDDLDGKWQRALSKIGASLSMLSHDMGHA